MADLAIRTSICSVVFVDIIDYSRAAVDRQVVMKERLNVAIRASLSNAQEDELIVLDSGDGAAICFFGDPEDALFAASTITGNLQGDLRLRSGINLGPVKIVTDLNGNRNVIGDAINVAQRVMSFADENELLISRSYFEVVSCLRDESNFQFAPRGKHKDKHVREHEVYSVAPKGVPGLSSVEIRNPTLDVSEPSEISNDLVAECSRRLAQSVGPIAGMMVKQALSKADDREEFLAALAASLNSDEDRANFLDGLSESNRVVTESEVDAPAASQPAQSSVESGAVDDALINRAASNLADALGPIAATLAGRVGKSASSTESFLTELAGHISDDDARRRFLAEMAKS